MSNEDKVPTFKQYTKRAHRQIAKKHGITISEAEREMPDHCFWSEWRETVVKEFVAGKTISAQMWRGLDEGLKWRLLRSPRALKDDDLTRRMSNM